MFKKFKNYIEERKEEGLVGEPKTKLVADYDGPNPKSPPSNGKEKPTPYKAANANEKPKKGETGFADQGDKTLKYEPDTKGSDSKMTSLGKEIPGEWSKKMSKTESFLHSTESMSATEFVHNVLNEHVLPLDKLPMMTAYNEGSFHPHPSEAIRYVVAVLATKNAKFLENFVFEAKKDNVLGELLKSILEHPEAYHELAALFADVDGEKRARNFARACSNFAVESVGPPMGLSDKDAQHHDDEEDEENPDSDEESDDEYQDVDLDDDGDGEGEEDMEDDGSEMDGEGKSDEDLDDEEKPPMPNRPMPHNNIQNAMNKQFMSR